MTKDELDHLVRLCHDAEKQLDFRPAYLQEGLDHFDTEAFLEGRRRVLEIEDRLKHEQMKMAKK